MKTKTILASLLTMSLLPAAPAGEPQAVATSINQFGLDLHQRLAAGGGNVVFSPWSIESALAMTWAGAAGKTKAEMASVLHLSGPDDAVHAGFQALAADLQKLAAASAEQVKLAEKRGGPSTPLEIHTANRLFGHNGYPFEKPFLTLTASAYGAPLEQMDFAGAPDQCRLTINQWVGQQTQERIKDLIPAGVIDAETRLVLTNAIYLKAPWAAEFGEEADAPFLVNGTQPVKVPGLRRHNETGFGYLKLPGGAAVTIPYAGGGLQMTIFLPEKADGLPALEKSLSPALLTSAANAPDRDILLHFPKFKLEPDGVMLADNLIAMGMPGAFDQPAGSADFSGMAPRKPDDYLKIGAVIHKAFLAVDKHGTEAAAATAVVMTRVMAAPPQEKPEPLEIRVDRPFAFAIQHKASGACLFLGRVTDPR